MKKDLIFLGMPGAGKSTLAKRLAEELGRPFVDTDTLIERAHHKSLQQLLDELGYLRMRDLEAQVLSRARLPAEAIVATGGSAVYSNDAMQHLQRNGIGIYLYAQLATLNERVHNLVSRGFNCAPDMSFAEVYHEREPLYRQYADIIVQVDGQTVVQTQAQLKVALLGYI